MIRMVPAFPRPGILLAGQIEGGRQLFDELLAAHKRAYPILIQLSRTLRQVGDESRARDLCEEAYKTGKAGDEKFAAAHLRSRLPKGIDDEIAWLEKADLAEPTIQIELNNSRGRKALSDDNRELAAEYWRKAIEGYRNVPETYTMLNNCGLVYLDLYLATGDIADHNKGLALLEQAMALAPGNSVLLINVSSLFVTRAYMDVVGDAIRFAALPKPPAMPCSGHSYQDDQGRAAFNRQLQQNEHMKKGIACLDKALLLAPKNPSLYGLAVHLHEVFGDLAELQKLQSGSRWPAIRNVLFSGSSDHIKKKKKKTYCYRFQFLGDLLTQRVALARVGGQQRGHQAGFIHMGNGLGQVLEEIDQPVAPGGGQPDLLAREH